MITEKQLRSNPVLIPALMGMPAEVFWDLMEQVAQRLPAYERQRLEREGRVRGVGAGRSYAQSLVVRVAVVLTYLRLHVPQQTVAALYGCSQWDVSRDLRRLLPLLRQVVPCPQIWTREQPAGEGEAEGSMEYEQGVDARVLVDATEQRISRPTNDEEQRACYSGKKKQHTLKTQIVTDGEHHILAISEAVAGKTHDKKVSDEVRTLDRVADGSQVLADSGYQGLAAQAQIPSPDAEPAPEQEAADLPKGQAQEDRDPNGSEPAPALGSPASRGVSVQTPAKKPRGGELSQEQKAANRAISQVRVRVEHCLGWVKNWAIIANRFRCARSVYTPILQFICGLVNAQTRRWQAAKLANCA